MQKTQGPYWSQDISHLLLPPYSLTLSKKEIRLVWYNLSLTNSHSLDYYYPRGAYKLIDWFSTIQLQFEENHFTSIYSDVEIIGLSSVLSNLVLLVWYGLPKRSPNNLDLAVSSVSLPTRLYVLCLQYLRAPDLWIITILIIKAMCSWTCLFLLLSQTQHHHLLMRVVDYCSGECC